MMILLCNGDGWLWKMVKLWRYRRAGETKVHTLVGIGAHGTGLTRFGVFRATRRRVLWKPISLSGPKRHLRFGKARTMLATQCGASRNRGVIEGHDESVFTPEGWQLLATG